MTKANLPGADEKNSSKIERGKNGSFPESARSGEYVFKESTIKEQLKQDVIKGANGTKYQYDAHFINIPILYPKDMKIAVNETADLLSYYNSKKKYTPVYTVENERIAKMPDKDGKAVTGVKKGSTTYTLEVTNKLGDKFSTIANINVVGKFAKNTDITKILLAGDNIISPEDKFTISIWSDDANDKKTTTLATGESKGLTGDIVELGIPNTIEETDIPIGYKLSEISITYKDSNGQTQSVPLEKVKGSTNAFSFTIMDLKAEHINVKVTNAIDKVPAGVVTLQKELLDAPINETDTFEIIVKGMGLPAQGKTYTISDGERVDLPELIVGQKYSIEEKSQLGYKLKEIKINKKVLAAENGKYFFTAPQSDTKGVDIVVVNELNQGSITLEKEIVNHDGLISSADDVFKFAIWQKDGREEDAVLYELTYGVPLDISDLYGGQSYYIKEIDKPNYSFIEFEGAAKITEDIYQFIFPQKDEDAVVISAKNKINFVPDNLIRLEKQLDGVALDPTDKFEVVLHGAALHSDGVSYSLPVDGTPVYLNGLIAGESYTIEEKEHEKSGYLKDYIGSSDNSINLKETEKDSGVYSFIAPTLDETGRITITVYNKNNILDKDKVQLKKEMKTGERANPLAKDFVVNIWWEKEEAAKTAYSVTAGSSHVPVTGLIAGEKYYIEEEIKTGYKLEDIKADGLKLEEKDGVYYFIAPQSSSSTALITVINALDKGTVQIEKLISNFSRPLDEKDDVFKFYIWAQGKEKTDDDIYEVTYGTPLVIDSFYGGQKYFIEEIPKNNYSFDSLKGADLFSERTYEFTAPLESEDSLAIQISNKINFVPDGMFKLEKVLDGELLEKNDTFEIVVNGKNQDNRLYELTANKPGISLDGLLAGEKYTVEEKISDNSSYLKDYIGSSDGSIELTEKSDGVYEFVAPEAEIKEVVTLTVYNKLNVLNDATVKLKKDLAKEEKPVKTDDTFGFTIWRAGTDKPSAPNNNISIGAPSNVSGLIANQKYYIEEQELPCYKLKSIEINNKPLEKDSIGYYFTTPSSDNAPIVIQITNDINYLPDGTVGIVKEMGYNEDNERYKPLKNDEKFKFYVWREGTAKPESANYETRVYRSEPEPLKNIISGAKYYISEEGKAGYLLEAFHQNGKLLEKDNIGYYFIAPMSAEDKLTITAENILDELPEEAVLIEKTMSGFQNPLNDGQRFHITIRPADRNSSSGVEKYNLKVDGDREIVEGLVAGGRYYVLEDEVEGYELDKVLYNGQEMDRDEKGYFFTAPSSVASDIITVVNWLDDGGDGTVNIVKFIEGKSGGAPELSKETFKVSIKGPKGVLAQAEIDSETAEVNWTSTPEEWLPGKYKVKEILVKDSAYKHAKTSVLINGEKVSNNNTFSLKEGDKVEIRLYNTHLEKRDLNLPKIPKAGGFPMELLGVIGGVVLITGAVMFSKDRKKGRSKDKTDLEENE